MINPFLRRGALALSGVAVFWGTAGVGAFAQATSTPCLSSTTAGIVIKNGTKCSNSPDLKNSLKAAISEMNAASQGGKGSSDSLSKRSPTGDALYRAQSLGLAGKPINKPYYGAQ